MRAALARRSASIMMNSSIKLWFVGGDVGWMTKMSSPRTFSSILTNVSPSGNGWTEHLPSSMPMDSQMAFAKGGLAVPQKIFTIVTLSTKTKHRRYGGRKSGGESNSRESYRNEEIKIGIK